MASDRLRNVLHAILLALAGGAIAWASSYGLYATATLATLLVLWIAAIGFIDHGVRLEAPPPPPPPVTPDLEARQRLTAYLDVSPAPLVALEAGRLRVVNRAARRLFGASDLVPDPPETLLAALSGTRPGRTATIDMTDETGTRSFALATGEIAMSGTLTRIGALIDIDAELKAAEATALRELIQVLSHEIVNALTPIASLADTAATMLDDPVPDLPEIREAIQTVARRAASLHRFGESYRALSRLPPPVLQRISVAQFVGDLAKLFATRWADIRFGIDTSDAPATVMADPDQLTAALWAILQNAAEALRGASTPGIDLVVTATIGRTTITIGDTGPGIATADQADVFRPFFTTKSEGTGVGLSLARQILRGHHGDLALIVSRPGRTEFQATLPTE